MSFALPDEMIISIRQTLHVVTRTTRGFKDIQDLTPGTKVYLGPDGSATRPFLQKFV